jgi:hypothetical protein
VTIDVLPEDALLEIFHFFVTDEWWVEEWRGLVHVCRKWRNIVFGSPRRLNLRLDCTVGTPVEMLDIWPPLPVNIKSLGCELPDSYEGMDDIVAALKHNDRINAIDICNIPTSEFGDILYEVEGPFPALTCLCLQFDEDWTALPGIPESFLGGFAPCLQALTLERISFPGLPTVLLSATHLVHLVLQEIPFFGSISPDAMATCLSVLTRLDELVL